MSLQGIFNTGVQGMNTQAHSMNTISTNIANVATTGYKTENTHFETLISEIQPQSTNQISGPGQPPTGLANFLSVKPVDSQNVLQQGQILTTNRTMDVAINGSGLLITNTAQDGTGSWQYTRDGSFYGQAVTLPTSTNGTGAPDQGTVLTTAGGAYVYGWAANADGTFTENNTLSSLVPITLPTDQVFPAQPTQNMALQANISNSMTGRETVAMPFIDASGNSQTLTLGVSGTIDQGYNLDYTSSTGGTVTADTTNITFNSDGSIATPTNGVINLTVNDPTGPQNLTLDLSKTTDYASTGDITVQNVSQDGFLSGTLSSTAFNSQGVLSGTFSNGQTKALYMLPLAQFPAADNLTAMPGNYYLQSQGSGAPEIVGLDNAGALTGGTAFVPGALESSTVDLSDQFSKMIVTQRAYSSSAQVVKAADEMTQAVRDLIS